MKVLHHAFYMMTLGEHNRVSRFSGNMKKKTENISGQMFSFEIFVSFLPLLSKVKSYELKFVTWLPKIHRKDSLA